MVWFLTLVALAGGWELPQRDADTVHEGDLKDGTVLTDLKWSENADVACLPATRIQHIMGSTVFYEHDVPAGENAYIQATPTSGQDLTVYVLQNPSAGGPGDTAIAKPPNVAFALGCVKSYWGAAGKPEKVKIGMRPDVQKLVVAVSGVMDVKEGGYKLEIWTGD